MTGDDLEAVIAIAAVVPTAPHWPPSEFRRMLRRIEEDPRRRGAWVASLLPGEPGSLETEASSLTTPAGWPREEPAPRGAAALSTERGSQDTREVTARAAGEVLGFAMASHVAGSAELEALVTAPGYRGRGIGTCLLASVTDWARSVGAAQLLLEVRASNAVALRLYLRHGFEQTGIRRGYYRNPDEDAALLTLALAGGGAG